MPGGSKMTNTNTNATKKVKRYRINERGINLLLAILGVATNVVLTKKGIMYNGFANILNMLAVLSIIGTVHQDETEFAKSFNKLEGALVIFSVATWVATLL